MPAYSSLGTLLKMDIATVMTTVAGVRSVEFEAPEKELYETDDLGTTNVNRDFSGRTSGGSVKASLFYDPAAASQVALAAHFNSPTLTSGVYVPTAWQVVWSVNPAATQPFTGEGIKQSRKAEAGSPLMAEIEIAVTRKPTLI